MADHRHKRDTEARRKPKALAVIAPLAVLATAGAVAAGVVTADTAVSNLSSPASAGAPSSSTSSTPNSPIDPSAAASPSLVDQLRDDPITRTEDRAKRARLVSAKPKPLTKQATRAAVKQADEKLWTTDDLNIWDQPGDKADLRGELEAGKLVLVTGREYWGRTEIVLNGQSRWVTSGYLSDEEPLTLGGECTNGTSVASGVSSNIVAIHEAVCANFPSISVYGTLRGGGGDHPQGKAVDIMVSGSLGWEVAEFVRENASAFGVSYVIYSQQIWSVERSGEGWRGMSNRGSDTANHYDHVHVSVY